MLRLYVHVPFAICRKDYIAREGASRSGLKIVKSSKRRVFFDSGFGKLN